MNWWLGLVGVVVGGVLTWGVIKILERVPAIAKRRKVGFRLVHGVGDNWTLTARKRAPRHARIIIDHPDASQEVLEHVFFGMATGVTLKQGDSIAITWTDGPELYAAVVVRDAHEYDLVIDRSPR